MPTVLNNACINRVAKVKKILFSSNDLASMVYTPYKLLNLKTENIYRVPSFFVLLSDSSNDYTGSLDINLPNGNYLYVDSYYSEVTSFLKLNIILGSSGTFPSNELYCKASADFEVGIKRPPVELHVYYYEESVSVPFEFNYLS